MCSVMRTLFWHFASISTTISNSLVRFTSYSQIHIHLSTRAYPRRSDTQNTCRWNCTYFFLALVFHLYVFSGHPSGAPCLLPTCYKVPLVIPINRYTNRGDLYATKIDWYTTTHYICKITQLWWCTHQFWLSTNYFTFI